MSKDFMYRPEIKSPQVKMAYKNMTKKENRILVIGDLHEPFCLDGYFEHCLKTYNDFNCNKVVFIGDIIDNHYSSYHESDPDGMGAGDELEMAIKKLEKWNKAFPVADVTIGNHDRMAVRKAFSGKLPKVWVKEYHEVLKTPQWNFVDRVVYDKVQYIHGEGGPASTKCRSDFMSTVQGHLHQWCYVQWYVGINYKVFGMQVGCGIDADSYAMAYGKRGKKPAIACGVVIGGHTAFNVPMEL